VFRAACKCAAGLPAKKGTPPTPNGGENVRLHEAEQQLITQAAAKQNPNSQQHPAAYEDLFDNKITWMLRDHDLHGYFDNEGIIWYTLDGYTLDTPRYDTRVLTLRVGQTATNEHRTALNNVLPEGICVKSVKRDRWVIAGLENARQVPFHNGIRLQHTSTGWSVFKPLPYPDKTHIPKPIQKMVKVWAGSYRPNLNHGACGLCIAHNEGLMEFDEANHLLEHILSGTLPFVMMDTIVKGLSDVGRTITAWDVTPFRQACYQIAVEYAYKTLRSTYA
jgi:hypothetical protein